jgi:hypothetical protein
MQSFVDLLVQFIYRQASSLNFSLVFSLYFPVRDRSNEWASERERERVRRNGNEQQSAHTFERKRDSTQATFGNNKFSCISIVLADHIIAISLRRYDEADIVSRFLF